MSERVREAVFGRKAPLFTPIAKAMRVASLRAPPESSMVENQQSRLVSTMVLVMILVDMVIVIMRPHAALACRHRIRCSRVLVCGGCGDAGGESGRKPPRRYILGIVANQETVTH